ncbi:hypothetical protein AB0H94_35230 [Streptomyces purpurascens]|uniref:hypothetical protein n=1 Tax=Streptomyces purpurascens TaxID=1924 RepID=UPI0033F61B60
MTTTPRTTAEAASTDGTGRIRAAKAPASGVSVPRHMGVGSDLVHSLDYVVLLQVMFNLASGMDSTPLSVWEQLKDRGIHSSKNARELVGKNAVYESFGRLLGAGYVRRQQLPHPTLPGRKGPVVYEVYDNPAWNPDWSPPLETEDHDEVNPQVATLPGTPDPSTGEADKSAGRNASRNTGRVKNGSGVPGSVKQPIPAGQNASQVRGSGMALPPHPPGEEDSSSPTPPSRPTGSLPSQREEGPEFSSEEITAAADFLQQMQRWQAGAATARSCAPKLLRTMREQGWPSLTDADARYLALLEAEVLKNTGGAASWTKCLPGWVRDLRRYALVRPQAAPAHRGSPRPAAVRSVIEACLACDEYGWLLDDDDSGPQRRCTHPGVIRSDVEAAK